MICKNCGYDNEEKNLFCKQCGTKLKEEENSPKKNIENSFEQNILYQKIQKKHNFKFCPNCGNPTNENIPYCLKCGENLISNQVNQYEINPSSLIKPKCPRCGTDIIPSQDKGLALNQDKCYKCGLNLTSPLEKVFKIAALAIWGLGFITALGMLNNDFLKELGSVILFIFFMYIMGGLIFFGIGEIIKQLYQINIYNTFKTKQKDE